MLCEMPEHEVSLSAKVYDNGQPVKLVVTTPRSAERNQSEGEGRWMFFTAVLGQGIHRIEFEIRDTGREDWKAKVSGWVMGDFLLEGRPLLGAAARSAGAG